jgi:hypothetical protein
MIGICDAVGMNVPLAERVDLQLIDYKALS